MKIIINLKEVIKGRTPNLSVSADITLNYRVSVEKNLVSVHV